VIEAPDGQLLPAMVGTSQPRTFGAAWAAANFCIYWGLTPYNMPELDAHWVHP